MAPWFILKYELGDVSMADFAMFKGVKVGKSLFGWLRDKKDTLFVQGSSLSDFTYNAALR